MRDLSEAIRLLGDDLILTDADLCLLTGLSRTTLWRRRRRGEGPPRIRLSDGRFGVRLGDARRWWQPTTK